jgi:hypothetical protein
LRLYDQCREVLNHYLGECLAGLGGTVVMLIGGYFKRMYLGAGQTRLANGLEVQQEQGVSMDKEIAIGTEAKVSVQVKDGKVFLVAAYDGKQLDADLKLGIEVDLFIDQLAEKIPGKVDDAILGVLKAALRVL